MPARIAIAASRSNSLGSVFTTHPFAMLPAAAHDLQTPAPLVDCNVQSELVAVPNKSAATANTRSLAVFPRKVQPARSIPRAVFAASECFSA
jgi:hypothetical protein